MITARDLDAALAAGPTAYRLGRLNVRTVRCALCAAGRLPGQARRVHLAARGWRAVFLCPACCPKGGT